MRSSLRLRLWIPATRLGPLIGRRGSAGSRSSRKFCRRRNRSATCRACGAPSRAPHAYRPQRSRLMISTSGCRLSHSAPPGAELSGSTSRTSRRSKSTMIVRYVQPLRQLQSSMPAMRTVVVAPRRWSTASVAAEWCRRCLVFQGASSAALPVARPRHDPEAARFQLSGVSAAREGTQFQAADQQMSGARTPRCRIANGSPEASPSRPTVGLAGPEGAVDASRTGVLTAHHILDTSHRAAATWGRVGRWRPQSAPPPPLRFSSGC